MGYIIYRNGVAIVFSNAKKQAKVVTSLQTATANISNYTLSFKSSGDTLALFTVSEVDEVGGYPPNPDPEQLAIQILNEFPTPGGMLQLATPKDLAATPGNTVAALVWVKNDAHAVTTDIQVATKNNFDPDFTTGYSHTDETLNLTDLTNGVTYYWRVRTKGPGYVTSLWAYGISFIPALPKLDTPTGFTATPGDTENVLAWDAVTDTESYTIEVSMTEDFASSSIVYTGSDTGFTHTELANDTTYYYRLKATATGFTNSDYATANATPVAP